MGDGICRGLNNASPQIHVHLGTQKLTLFGNRVFEDVMKVRIKMRSYQIRVGTG